MVVYHMEHDVRYVFRTRYADGLARVAVWLNGVVRIDKLNGLAFPDDHKDEYVELTLATLPLS